MRKTGPKPSKSGSIPVFVVKPTGLKPNWPNFLIYIKIIFLMRFQSIIGQETGFTCT
ncbi:hypothetical protein RchiOBHm_Chr2g0117371 [Rosa chinensis]|uniref:Uncharacterized protein n=1 Tax=Rosa chinensis TaxID=74649 RepID=A0A2P6RRH4_ROSCH|nr:hypothetical protein RchiOBHm_Chr2g0117371 [Rosa chinensis]